MRYFSWRDATGGGRKRGTILFAIGSLTVGGAESQLVMLAEQLVQRGWKVEVYALDTSGSLRERLCSAGINIIDGGYRSDRGTKATKMIALVMCELSLCYRLLRARPGVVHGFLPLTNFMAALAARAAFIPLVITSKRALGKHQDRHPKLRWMDRMANALSHIITANSKAVSDDTVRRDGYPASRIVVIPNGLDFSRFENSETQREECRLQLGLDASDIAIVNVANLIPYKGHGELVKAFGMLALKDSRLKLFLVGEDRGIWADLLDEAKKFGVAERIRLMGRRSDVPELLSAMDIGVMASHEEGSSNALLEKLAAGLPVVATNVGGNPEALDGMPGCELVQPMEPADLARGMTIVIERLETSDKQRCERRRLVRGRFSVDAMVDAYERLYLSRMAGGTH